MRIFVGNLAYQTTQDALVEAFAAFGEVASAAVPTDRETGKPRGFAFVEMPNDEQAKAAIEGLNGKELDGRKINVNEARPRPEGGAGGEGRATGGPRGGGGFDIFGGGRGQGGGGRRGGGRGREARPKGDNATRRPMR